MFQNPFAALFPYPYSAKKIKPPCEQGGFLTIACHMNKSFNYLYQHPAGKQTGCCGSITDRRQCQYRLYQWYQ